MKIYDITLLSACGEYISTGIVSEDGIEKFKKVFATHLQFPKVCINRTWTEAEDQTDTSKHLMIVFTSKGSRYIRVNEEV